MFSKRGFTLAEVLITLGIIGVVAAMTLPTLLQRYQKNLTNRKQTKTNIFNTSTGNSAIRSSQRRIPILEYGR